MSNEQTNNSITGVPRQVFEEFLSSIDEKTVPPEVITRLRNTILEKCDISVEGLSCALFEDSNTDL